MPDEKDLKYADQFAQLVAMEPHGAVLVFRDASEARRAVEARLHLAAIVESCEDAIISKDLQGIITSWNRGAELLYGYTAEEIVGKSLSILVPDDHPDELPSIMERIRRGERVEHFETQRVCKDGRRVDVSLTISPVRNAEGIVVGASKIARDITARKDEDRRKNEFLALLAHELRNPLAPLRNGLEVIKMARNNSAAISETRSMMERQLQHMSRLVDDLLDVSRINRGTIELRRERGPLAAIVSSALETCQPLIQQRGHELTVTLPDAPLYVDADQTRLAQVLANLLGNAAKYTEPGGRIWLTVGHEGHEAVIRVKDNGVGIPVPMLPRVFDMFMQVDHSLEKAQGGLGVGLSIVKRLVEMHGGSVEANSDGHGRGSEFVVRLPIVLSIVPDQRDEIVDQPRRPMARYRILVVDDNVDAASSLALMLKLMGNEVQTAHDGLAGVQAATAFRPEMIILDIGMPKLNGYDACRRIREEPWGRQATIFALTGWGQDDDKARSLQAGFDGHLVKPVQPANLQKLLGELKAKTA